MKASDFTTPRTDRSAKSPPNRIDLLTSFIGVSLEEALASRIAAEVDKLPVSCLSKTLLIAKKRAVGSLQDLADLAELED